MFNDENGNVNNNPENQRFHSNETVNFINSLNEIHSINQNIQTYARRALDLQNGSLEMTIWKQIFTLKNFKYMMHSAYFFLFSSLIFSIFAPGLYYSFSKIPEEKLTLSFLESEDMNLSYIVILVFCFLSFWNFYLFFALCVFKCDYANFNFDNQKGNYIMIVDAIYFNPFFFCFVVWYFNKNLYTTGFDVFSWLLINFLFFVNFCFTAKLYIYSNVKISQISNTSLIENIYFMRRTRLHFLFLTALNVALTYILKILLEDSNFSIRYLILFKGVYIISKQVEYYIITELNYKYLIWGTNIKEENFIRNLSLKSKLQILNMILILHKLLLASFVLLFSGHALVFFFPLMLVVINLIFNIAQNYNSYLRVKNFYSQLEDLFPKIEMEKEEECVICTENLLVARKLVCNHYFHLICLSKWLEKGNKSCPICRKEINFQTGSTVNQSSPANNNIWSFGLRLDGRLFSWLPNITFRIIRVNNNNTTVNEGRDNNNIFAPRENVNETHNNVDNILNNY